MNLGDRGPNPSFYDPPYPAFTYKCDACDGSGVILDESDCDCPNCDHTTVCGLCKDRHPCQICGGGGEI